MAIKRSRGLRWVSRAAIICCMIIGLTSAVFAEDGTPETSEDPIADNGVEEINEAYDYTVETGEGIGASAGISSGGWASLGSKLSYMKFPEGITTTEGEDGIWCYCIDISTDTQNGHKYSITTLDAAQYYEPEAGDKIRSILLNSYPNIPVSDLEKLHQLTGLTEEEAFMATQWILWYYSNPDGLVDAGGGKYYPANIYKPSEYPKDTITVWYDDEDGNEVRAQSKNIVSLAKILDQLAPAGAYETEPANIFLEKTEYNDKVIFDYSGSKGLDTLKNTDIIVKDSNGNTVPFALKGHSIVIQKADIPSAGNTVELTVEFKAEQILAKDVYFFSPEGGRDASQSRVAAYEGIAPVAVTEVFSLTADELAEKDPQVPDKKLDETPKTGDGFSTMVMMALMILMALAAAGAVSTVAIGRKRG